MSGFSGPLYAARCIGLWAQPCMRRLADFDKPILPIFKKILRVVKQKTTVTLHKKC